MNALLAIAFVVVSISFAVGIAYGAIHLIFRKSFNDDVQ